MSQDERRVNVQLDGRMHKRLKEIAEETGLPIASMVKSAVAKWLETYGEPLLEVFDAPYGD